MAKEKVVVHSKEQLLALIEQSKEKGKSIMKGSCNICGAACGKAFYYQWVKGQKHIYYPKCKLARKSR